MNPEFLAPIEILAQLDSDKFKIKFLLPAFYRRYLLHEQIRQSCAQMVVLVEVELIDHVVYFQTNGCHPMLLVEILNAGSQCMLQPKIGRAHV